MNLSRLNLLCATVVVACVLYSAPALAQRPGTADLVGSVTDESRAVLPAATVVARHQLTGVSHDTITGADGTYRFVSLTPGVYEITARMDGFRSVAYPDVRVSVGEVARLDFHLALSALSETITVVARPPAVDVAQTQLGQVVQSEQLANLPVGIRSFINFASLAPGVNANFARAGRVVHRRRAQLQRPGHAVRQLHHRRRAQQRRLRRPDGGGADRHQPRCDRRIPGPDQPVLGRVRPQHGHRAQHGDQVGHQQLQRFGLAVCAQRRARGDQRVHQAGGLAEAAVRAGAVRRQHRRADRARSHAFFVNSSRSCSKIGQTVFVPTRPDLNQNAATTFNVREHLRPRRSPARAGRHAPDGTLRHRAVAGHGAGRRRRRAARERRPTKRTATRARWSSLTSTWTTQRQPVPLLVRRRGHPFNTAAGYPVRAEEIHPGFRAGSAQFIFGTPFEVPVHWTDRSFQFEDSFSRDRRPITT